MTLKEKFLPFVDYINLINDIPDKEECGLRNADKCVEVADEFAIGFAEWVIHNYPSKGTNHEDKWLYSEKTGPIGWSIESLLEIYKKEKGL